MNSIWILWHFLCDSMFPIVNDLKCAWIIILEGREVKGRAHYCVFLPNFLKVERICIEQNVECFPFEFPSAPFGIQMRETPSLPQLSFPSFQNDVREINGVRNNIFVAFGTENFKNLIKYFLIMRCLPDILVVVLRCPWGTWVFFLVLLNEFALIILSGNL